MNETEIRQLVHRQRTFFLTGTTLDIDYRIQALAALKDCIRKHEKQIHAALRLDLGKSNFESYLCETGMVLGEISYMQKHIRSFSRERTVRTPLAQFPSRSFQKPGPYGTVLIMSPWNYPFLLTLGPLIDAISAGNTAILKPSAYSPHTAKVLHSMIRECFDDAYIAVVTGGRRENSCLLNEPFDYLFFTGSQSVGREVMKRAAVHLTPVTLELGGKSPCIVEKTANLSLAAKRIVFGKFLNCGQTCVAPDYIYCDPSIKDALLKEIKKQIEKQYGTRPLENPAYGKIINQKHFDRISGLIDRRKLVYGGDLDRSRLKIAPAVLDQVSFSDAVMQEEIFGPVLPILTYRSLDDAIRRLNTLPHPLALYIFTSDKRTAQKVLSRCSFGGGCINDTVIHLATSEMGFGGFGASGMGSYHGKEGFDTFTHYKSIVDKKTWLDLPMRYQPSKKIHEKLIRMFLR